MAEKQFLTHLFKQLGLYQATLLLSRLFGIFRDVLILLVVGAGVLTDQIFFIFSFPDIFMSLLVGGGSILYLNDCYNEKNKIGSYKSIALSSSLIYVLIAVIFILSEWFFSAPVGKLLYSDIVTNSTLLTSYLLSICALVFSLAMVAPNSIFLYREKLYLQPLMNIVFTIVVIIAIISAYYLDELSTNVASIIIIIAAFSRLLWAFFLSSRMFKKDKKIITLISDISFYKNLILSGISIGILILLPFIFRAKLPEFGEGLYASSSIYFKFNDLILAFFIIPVTTIFLKKMSNKIDYRLLSIVLLFSIVSVVGFLLVIKLINYLNVKIPILSIAPDLANYVIITLVFSSAAYITSMLLVKKGLHIISSLAALMSLIYLFYMQAFMGDDLIEYFYHLYYSYCIYILLAHLLSLFFIKYKSDSFKRL